MRYFSHELAYSFTHADRRGIFFTIKALFTRPGHMLREYILGHRANYFRPFPLLIILATLFGITAHLVERKWELASGTSVEQVEPAGQEESMEEWLEDIAAGYSDAVRESAGDTVQVSQAVSQADRGVLDENSLGWNVLKDVGGWFWAHQEIFSVLLLLPFFAFAMKRAFRHVGVTRYNYAECLYVSAYMFCQRFIVQLVLLPMDFVWKDSSWGWVLVIFFALSVWTFKQFFGISVRRSFWRTLWLGVILCVSLVGFVLLASTVAVLTALLITGDIRK